jgi:hypothetical protein
MKKASLILFGILFFSLTAYTHDGHCRVLKENKMTFLIDRAGEKWDITQAVSIGFDPKRFQYGLGKNAIRPLDDTNLGKAALDVAPDLRILGIDDGKHSAQAYSVPKLARHEVANSSMGSVPIAAAY